MRYELKYADPHDFDDGDSGGGGHEINWTQHTIHFNAEDHDEARRKTVRFVLDFVHFLNENPRTPYYRDFKTLIAVEDIGLTEEYTALLADRDSRL